ncbi:Piwi-domain-containing protein [Aureobasidium pullulans]|uniref:Piwi-domain-containing protein n=1 Tax=Aureobasidium pullulans TaxID=5580 RepID=A0A4S9TX84_AURPU|nr:Piwi-domain-containing protein [Aureobasidium pullulans]
MPFYIRPPTFHLILNLYQPPLIYFHFHFQHSSTFSIYHHIIHLITPCQQRASSPATPLTNFALQSSTIFTSQSSLSIFNMLGSSKRNAQREGQSGGASSTQSGPRLDLARFDGNRDPAPGPAPQIVEGISNNVKNVDVGATMWSDARGARHTFAGRLPASTLGRAVDIQLNAFPVSGLPKAPIYQYQVMVGTGAEKRGLIKAVWNSQATRSKLGPGWIFDGNSLAWSTTKHPAELRFNVNLDEEAGHAARPGRTDVHRVVVRPTAVIDFTCLDAYLTGTATYDTKILQAITVLDHIMRETPSSRFISIKRNFFAANSQRSPLGGHVEHTTGVYQSLRIAHHPAGHRLVVNADVANGTFWSSGPLSAAVLAVTKSRSEADIQLLLRQGNPKFFDLRRLRKLHVVTVHRKGGSDEYVIDHFMDKDSTYVLKFKDGTSQTVAQYFQATYNVRLKYPGWPVVQMTRKAVLPLELLKIKDNQRYTFKLDDVQTSQMIKRAVTPPRERWAAIDAGVKMLDWASDPYLRNYGMAIDPKPIVAKGRLLVNPKLQFGGTGTASQTDPKTSGRWDLKGKKFASTPALKDLSAWGVCVLSARGEIDKAAVQRFLQSFIQTYAAHGATLPPAYRDPAIYYAASNADPASFAQEAFQLAGNKHNSRPQLLMFILQDKNSITYGKIKRFCECKLGIPSQCVQYAHVQKAQAQYISNVLMKFNAKLGGFTNTVFGPVTSKKAILDNSVVIIGADVSHAAPGLNGPSMAAMTVSMNANATRYAAAVETNGHRVEMITDENIEKHIISLIKNGWSRQVGQGKAPATVVYFRDGVSEGQFAQVIDQEVAAMKKAFAKINVMPRFLVIIASKRHHVRFFPQSGGDKNANPLPGTLVETGVTQPFENDFYLCAHTAIKGTARPVHYNVLLNEPQWPQDKIHTLIYEHSYQYIRATTPVSLFPAVHYAHIASLRGAHHSKGFGNPAAYDNTVTGTTDPVYEPLLPMANPAIMNPGMWFI